MGATQTQLNQAAANIAQVTKTRILAGDASDDFQRISLNIVEAILCLVEYNANNSTTTLNLVKEFAPNVPLSNLNITPKPKS